MSLSSLVALALQRARGLRPEEKLMLFRNVKDEADLASLDRADLEAAVGRRLLSRSGLSLWEPRQLLAAAAADARFLEKTRTFFVHFDDPRYPALLRATFSPPFGLYMRGSPLDNCLPCLAVVGTRTPTGLGMAEARRLACDFARSGLPLVSGLARGIDSAAHRGALDGAGPTCAVLPCGLDRVYPLSNKALAASILESGGLLLSEYPPGTEMGKYRFPERNRIIAGMSRACLVIEAPAGSGALITAEHALGEGRDVWVASRCVAGPRSAGSDELARDGAPLLEEASELLADWNREAPVVRRPEQEFLSETLCPADRATGLRALVPARKAPAAGESVNLARALGRELGLPQSGER